MIFMRKQPLFIDGHEVIALPSAWHQVLGLSSYSGSWVSLFDTNSPKQAWDWVGRLCHETGSTFGKYDDFTVLSPELPHEIPKSSSGQERQYLERTSPATAGARYAAAHQRSTLSVKQ